MKRTLPALLVLALALAASGQEMPVPAGLQGQIFVKVLMFDRSYEGRARDGFVSAVLYQGGFRRSYLAGEEFSATVMSPGDASSGTGPIRCLLIDVDRERDLPAALASAAADIIYVAPLRSYDIASIARAARDLRLPVYTGVPEYLADGLAVSLEIQDEKPRILINLKAAKEQGANFDSRILSLARIVEGAPGEAGAR